MRIKADWAHSKLKIPMAEEKDAILQPVSPSFGDGAGGLAGLAADRRRRPAPAQLARLKAAPGDPTNTAADAIDSLVDAMLDEWQANSDPVHAAIQQALDSSTSFEDFQGGGRAAPGSNGRHGAGGPAQPRHAGGPPLGQSDQRRTHLTWPPSSWSRCRRERLSSSFARRATGWRSPGRTCLPRTRRRLHGGQGDAAGCAQKSAAPPTARSPRARRFRTFGARSARSCRTRAGGQARDGRSGHRRDGQCAARQRCQVAQDLDTNVSTAYSEGSPSGSSATLSCFLPAVLAQLERAPSLVDAAFAGRVMRADDPWWQSHMPVKEWGCKCGCCS